jgi:hypothetical protein
MGTVGIVFAPLAPLVPVAAALVMWISSWVYKYQLMFVFVTRVETGGVSVLIQYTINSHLKLYLALMECGHQPSFRWRDTDAVVNGLE